MAALVRQASVVPFIDGDGCEEWLGIKEITRV
jgi:hypothetical protein